MLKKINELKEIDIKLKRLENIKKQYEALEKDIEDIFNVEQN